MRPPIVEMAKGHGGLRNDTENQSGRPFHVFGNQNVDGQPRRAGDAHFQRRVDDGAIERAAIGRLHGCPQQSLERGCGLAQIFLLGHQRPFLLDHYAGIGADGVVQSARRAARDSAQIVRSQQGLAFGENRFGGQPVSRPYVIGEKTQKQREQRNGRPGKSRNDANDPPYDEMLERMKQYVSFGGTKPLLGGEDAEARFARLVEYSKYLPDPKNETEAVAGALSLMRIGQVPFRDPVRAEDRSFWGAAQTNWVSAADVTNKVYYVSSATTPSLFWLDFKEANFEPGAPLLYLDLHDPKIGGDARTYLQRWKAPS